MFDNRKKEQELLKERRLKEERMMAITEIFKRFIIDKAALEKEIAELETMIANNLASKDIDPDAGIETILAMRAAKAKLLTLSSNKIIDELKTIHEKMNRILLLPETNKNDAIDSMDLSTLEKNHRELIRKTDEDKGYWQNYQSQLRKLTVKVPT
ncbi:hypothetical protein [Aquicella lusitana]|uniref:Uncharacterized protein n=1 Tax=Aquicella lusitana TaxID=254246 RepID=A0A370G364_9COXI|nr:hypothetical protein [Aquicella lusitana]RDI37269.1 hypothetical protein C8D86_1401 [Aquicella lusitana]VVC73650.1 hypothetical protein AQULUS_13970 [Aquicella lusitana]